MTAPTDKPAGDGAQAPSRPARKQRSRYRPSRMERYSWRFHWRFAVGLGTWGGVNLHSPYLLTKEFGVAPDVIAVFFALAIGSLLLGIVSGPLMQGRRKRPFLLIVGCGGRAGSVLMAFAPVTEPWLFLLGFGMTACGEAFLIPAITSFYQSGYTDAGRSRAFSRAQLVATSATILASVGTGFALEQNPNTRTLLFLLAGVAGAFAHYSLSRMRFRQHGRAIRPVRAPIDLVAPGLIYGGGEGLPGILPAPRSSIRGATERLVRGLRRALRVAVVEPIGATLKLYATDRRFLRFELQFMLYGFGFLAMMPVLPEFLTEKHNINYEEVGLITVMVFQGVIALSLLVVSRFYRPTNPIGFVAMAIGALIPVPLMFLFATDMTGIILAYAWWAVAMAGIHLVWNMVAIYFAGDSEVTGYMGAHVLAVGLRGAIVPFVGAGLITSLGPETAFGVSATAFALGFVLMAHMALGERKRARRGALTEPVSAVSPPRGSEEEERAHTAPMPEAHVSDR